MSSILKGNFEPKKPVETDAPKTDDSVEARFEREALKRLGGSIAFVAKKKIMWEADPAKKAGPREGTSAQDVEKDTKSES